MSCTHAIKPFSPLESWLQSLESETILLPPLLGITNTHKLSTTGSRTITVTAVTALAIAVKRAAVERAAVRMEMVVAKTPLVAVLPAWYQA